MIFLTSNGLTSDALRTEFTNAIADKGKRCAIIPTAMEKDKDKDVWLAETSEELNKFGLECEYFWLGTDANEKLYECSDIYIDNCVCHGDAVISIPGCEVKMGSVSTCVSTFAVQSVLIEGAARAKKNGASIPVYMSGNIENGAKYNSKLIKEYLPRIKHL